MIVVGEERDAAHRTEELAQQRVAPLGPRAHPAAPSLEADAINSWKSLGILSAAGTERIAKEFPELARLVSG